MIIRRISTGSFLTALKDEEGACFVWGKIEDAIDTNDGSIIEVLEKYDPFNYEYFTKITCINGYFANKDIACCSTLVFEIEEFLTGRIIKGCGKLLYLPHDQAVKEMKGREGSVDLYWKRQNHPHFSTYELRVK